MVINDLFSCFWDAVFSLNNLLFVTDGLIVNVRKQFPINERAFFDFAQYSPAYITPYSILVNVINGIY